MGFLDGLFGGNGNATVPNSRVSRNISRYAKVLTEADFTTTDHQLLTSTTDWTEIAYYTVPAAQRLRAGYGDPGHPENQGRVYVYIRTGETTPAEITGKWRVVVRNRAKGSLYHVIQEFDEELTHGDLNDKRKLLPLPEGGPVIGEDDILCIEFKPGAAHATAGAGNDNIGWADATESLLKIPVTIAE